MAMLDYQNPNESAIELSLDFASRSNNPVLLAGACAAHPAFLLIPYGAANAIANIVLRGTTSLIEQELVNEAADFLRAIEKRFNEVHRFSNMQWESNSCSELSARQNPSIQPNRSRRQP